MIKIGVVHATTNAVKPFMETFYALYPEVKVLNFVNENLLFRANQIGGVDLVGLREFTKTVFHVAEAGVDGIVVACSIYCPFVQLMKNFIDIPIIAVDDPMIKNALKYGKIIGIIATTKVAGPSTEKRITELAQKLGQPIRTEVEIVTDGMNELNKGNVAGHNKFVLEAGERLIKKGCDLLVLSQISMACATNDMKYLPIKILTSPTECIKAIMTMIKLK